MISLRSVSSIGLVAFTFCFTWRPIVGASIDLTVNQGETLTIVGGEYENVFVLGGTLLVKGEIVINQRLRVSRGAVTIEGRLSASEARVDISLGQLTVHQPDDGQPNRAKSIIIGQSGILETFGGWETESLFIFENGNLQTPPGTSHPLSIQAEAFSVANGGGVHVTGDWGGFSTPVKGGNFSVDAQSVRMDGGIYVSGSHSHDGVGAGDAGSVRIQSEVIDSFDGVIFAKGGSAFDGSRPGSGGAVEIRVAQGELPATKCVFAGRGVSSGNGDWGPLGGRVVVGRPEGKRLLRIVASVAGGMHLSFERSPSEGLILQQSSSLFGGWEERARFTPFNPESDETSEVHHHVLPSEASKLFFRLVPESE